MSILFLSIVLAALRIDPSLIEAELLYLWALFAIADALWVNALRGKK